MSEDDEEITTTDDLANAVNAEILDLLGSTVKLSIIMAEMPRKQISKISSRWNAFVSAVNAVELVPEKKSYKDS